MAVNRHDMLYTNNVNNVDCLLIYIGSGKVFWVTD